MPAGVDGDDPLNDRRHEDGDASSLLERQIDIVTFTSGSSVTNFVRALGTDQAADLLKRVDVACIGPVTADVATQLDISTTIMPSDYTVPAMVRAIVDHVTARKRHEEH